MRSASGMASWTALSFRARLGADGDWGSLAAGCVSVAWSNDRFVRGGGDVVAGVADTGAGAGAGAGAGGDDVACPFFSVDVGSLRVAVKKL